MEADFLWREPELESDSDDVGEGNLRDLLDFLRWPRSSDWCRRFKPQSRLIRGDLAFFLRVETDGERDLDGERDFDGERDLEGDLAELGGSGGGGGGGPRSEARNPL